MPDQVDRVGTVTVNGVDIGYSSVGSGEPVLFVTPAASRASIWHTYQVPALRQAGLRVTTFDNRGSPPSSVPPGPYRLAELTADTAGLIDALQLGPCRVVGASIGAFIAQELALVRPDLVKSVALITPRGRTDAFRAALAAASAEAARDGRAIPARYAAVSTLLQLLSPATLANDRVATDWIDLAMAFPVGGEGAAAQYEATVIPDRLDALTGITCPALVMAFADDVVVPPHFVREVAEAIPGSELVEIDRCGHFGFLERPDVVNRILIEFLTS